MDTLSLLSLDSYEADEEWNAVKYRKLLFKYDREERQYAILNQCRDLDVLKEPEHVTELNRELALSRKELEQQQKKGARLKEIAKAQANFMRQRQNIVQEATRIEQLKHCQEREEWYKLKEAELAERARNWNEVTKKEIGKKTHEQEKRELQALRVKQEQLYQEEMDQKLACETDLLQRLEQQQLQQEALLNRQKEERSKDYQEWQEDKLAWEENQGLRDQIVRDLREALKKEQEASTEERERIASMLDKKDEEVPELITALEGERSACAVFMKITKQQVNEV